MFKAGIFVEAWPVIILLLRHLLVSGGGSRTWGEKDVCPVQPFLWWLDFLAIRQKVLCRLTEKGRRTTTSFWITCSDTQNVSGPYMPAMKIPLSQMWVQGHSWGALHIKSQVFLLMSRNKWLQQMREVQENSKTGYLAVHQLLRHCQAFCWHCKEKI